MKNSSRNFSPRLKLPARGVNETEGDKVEHTERDIEGYPSHDCKKTSEMNARVRRATRTRCCDVQRDFEDTSSCSLRSAPGSSLFCLCNLPFCRSLCVRL